jgi:DNA primase
MIEIISQDIVDRIRERHDIVRVVAKYAGPFVLAGDNFVRRCPFCLGTTPRFTVSSRYQIFHCFDCEVGGNVFTFVKRITGMSFSKT